MAKPKTPRAKAKAFAADSILDDTNPTPPVTAATDGGQAPAPAQGNEGQAATAGEGQPSLANPASPPDAPAAPPVGEGSDAPDQDAGNTTAEPETPPPPPPPEQQPMASLVVTGPKKGRWRAGRSFGPAPVTILVSDLSDAEIASLMADERLAVQVVHAPY